MFVQYSFVQRRPTARAAVLNRPSAPSEALVMSAGIAFMAVTSALYALTH